MHVLYAFEDAAGLGERHPRPDVPGPATLRLEGRIEHPDEVDAHEQLETQAADWKIGKGALACEEWCACVREAWVGG